jgi:hypothetical protein
VGSSSFLRAGRRFPAAITLTLLYVLIVLQAVRSASQTVPSASPPRITRPPGQLLITEPRCRALRVGLAPMPLTLG